MMTHLSKHQNEDRIEAFLKIVTRPRLYKLNTRVCLFYAWITYEQNTRLRVQSNYINDHERILQNLYVLHRRALYNFSLRMRSERTKIVRKSLCKGVDYTDYYNDPLVKTHYDMEIKVYSPISKPSKSAFKSTFKSSGDRCIYFSGSYFKLITDDTENERQFMVTKTFNVNSRIKGYHSTWGNDTTLPYSWDVMSELYEFEMDSLAKIDAYKADENLEFNTLITKFKIFIKQSGVIDILLKELAYTLLDLKRQIIELYTVTYERISEYNDFKVKFARALTCFCSAEEKMIDYGIDMLSKLLNHKSTIKFIKIRINWIELSIVMSDSTTGQILTQQQISELSNLNLLDF
jgi:hypothetical protein